MACSCSCAYCTSQDYAEDCACEYCQSESTTTSCTCNQTWTKKGLFTIAWNADTPELGDGPCGMELEIRDTPSNIEQKCKELQEWLNCPPIEDLCKCKLRVNEFSCPNLTKALNYSCCCDNRVKRIARECKCRECLEALEEMLSSDVESSRTLWAKDDECEQVMEEVKGRNNYEKEECKDYRYSKRIRSECIRAKSEKHAADSSDKPTNERYKKPNCERFEKDTRDKSGKKKFEKAQDRRYSFNKRLDQDPRNKLLEEICDKTHNRPSSNYSKLEKNSKDKRCEKKLRNKSKNKESRDKSRSRPKKVSERHERPSRENEQRNNLENVKNEREHKPVTDRCRKDKTHKIEQKDKSRRYVNESTVKCNCKTKLRDKSASGGNKVEETSTSESESESEDETSESTTLSESEDLEYLRKKIKHGKPKTEEGKKGKDVKEKRKRSISSESHYVMKEDAKKEKKHKKKHATSSDSESMKKKGKSKKEAKEKKHKKERSTSSDSESVKNDKSKKVAKEKKHSTSSDSECVKKNGKSKKEAKEKKHKKKHSASSDSESETKINKKEKTNVVDTPKESKDRKHKKRSSTSSESVNLKQSKVEKSKVVDTSKQSRDKKHKVKQSTSSDSMCQTKHSKQEHSKLEVAPKESGDKKHKKRQSVSSDLESLRKSTRQEKSKTENQLKDKKHKSESEYEEIKIPEDPSNELLTKIVEATKELLNANELFKTPEVEINKLLKDKGACLKICLRERNNADAQFDKERITILVNCPCENLLGNYKLGYTMDNGKPVFEVKSFEVLNKGDVQKLKPMESKVLPKKESPNKVSSGVQKEEVSSIHTQVDKDKVKTETGVSPEKPKDRNKTERKSSPIAVVESEIERKKTESKGVSPIVNEKAEKDNKKTESKRVLPTVKETPENDHKKEEPKSISPTPTANNKQEQSKPISPILSDKVITSGSDASSDIMSEIKHKVDSKLIANDPNTERVERVTNLDVKASPEKDLSKQKSEEAYFSASQVPHPHKNEIEEARIQAEGKGIRDRMRKAQQRRLAHIDQIKNKLP